MTRHLAILPLLLVCSLLQAGQVLLSWTASPFIAAYGLQYSTDMVNWVTLTNGTETNYIFDCSKGVPQNPSVWTTNNGMTYWSNDCSPHNFFRVFYLVNTAVTWTGPTNVFYTEFQPIIDSNGALWLALLNWTNSFSSFVCNQINIARYPN